MFNNAEILRLAAIRLNWIADNMPEKLANERRETVKLIGGAKGRIEHLQELYYGKKPVSGAPDYWRQWLNEAPGCKDENKSGNVINCAHCGAEFVKLTHPQKYCCQECKETAAKIKARASNALHNAKRKARAAR